MISYDLFKKIIPERVSEALPPVFDNFRPRIAPVNKINELKDALIFEPKNRGCNIALPTIYLDDMYKWFSECEDMDMIVSAICEVIVNYTNNGPAEIMDIDFRTYKDSVVFNLVNTDLNEELLKNVPHRKYMDLALIYRICINFYNHGMDTLIVTDSVMKDMEVDEDELYRLAKENTKHLFPHTIRNVGEELYIISNDMAMHGAANLIYDDVLKEAADLVDGDYYILPSSVHEIIVIPADKTNSHHLLSMLIDGNKDITRDKEILSNSIYKYNAAEESISIAASYNNYVS